MYPPLAICDTSKVHFKWVKCVYLCFYYEILNKITKSYFSDNLLTYFITGANYSLFRRK